MGKLTRALCSTVLSVFLGASPAIAQDPNPAHNATLYYDAAHQNFMGRITWVGCDRFNIPLYQVTEGTYQYQHYAVSELVGYCVDGEMVPL
jgi:hypothetical protein